MSENGAKPSVQALDAFAEWMRRADQWMRRADQALENGASLAFARALVRRIEALEALHNDAKPQEAPASKHWSQLGDATVQLRRDVGTLVRAAREVIAEIDRDEGVRAARVSALRAAVNIFAGDYT